MIHTAKVVDLYLLHLVLKVLEKADVWAVFFSRYLLVWAYRFCNTIQHWVRIDLGL